MRRKKVSFTLFIVWAVVGILAYAPATMAQGSGLEGGELNLPGLSDLKYGKIDFSADNSTLEVTDLSASLAVPVLNQVNIDKVQVVKPEIAAAGNLAGKSQAPADLGQLAQQVILSGVKLSGHGAVLNIGTIHILNVGTLPYPALVGADDGAPKANEVEQYLRSLLVGRFSLENVSLVGPDGQQVLFSMDGLSFHNLHGTNLSGLTLTGLKVFGGGDDPAHQLEKLYISYLALSPMIFHASDQGDPSVSASLRRVLSSIMVGPSQITNLKLSNPDRAGESVSFERLTFGSLSGMSLGDLSIQGLKLEKDPGDANTKTVKVGKIDVGFLELAPSIIKVAMFSMKDDEATRIKKMLSIIHLGPTTVENLAVLRADKPEESFTVEKISLQGLVGSNLDQFTVTNLALATKHGSKNQVFTFGTLNLTDLDVDPAILKAMTDQDDELAMVELVLTSFKAGAFELNDLAFTESGKRTEKVALNHLRLSGLDGSYFDELVVDGLAFDSEKEKAVFAVERFLLTEAGLDGRFFDRIGSLEDLSEEAMGAEAIKALFIGKAQLDNMTIQDKHVPAEGEMHLANVTVEGIEEARIEDFALNDFFVRFEKTRSVKLQTIAMSNLDYSEAVKYVAQGGMHSGPPTSNLAKYEFFTLKGLEISVPEAGLIKLAEMTTNDIEYDGLIPTAFNFDIVGLDVPLDKIPNPAAQMIFAQLQQTNLVADFNVNVNYDPDMKELYLNNISLSLRDLGELAFKLQFSDADLKPVQDPFEALDMVGKMKLYHFEIIYKDHSLVDKALLVAGQMQGMDQAQMRDMAIQQAEGAKMMLQNSPGGPEVVDGMVSFLRQPGSIRVVLEPEEALPIMTIAEEGKSSPEKILNNVNIFISYNDSELINFKPPLPGAPPVEAPKAGDAAPGQPVQPEPPQPVTPPTPPEAKVEKPAPSEPSAAGEQKASPLGDYFKKNFPKQ